MAETMPKVRPRIGIALSGGALKAAAHVGVLNALARMGVEADCVAGTSAGALIAAAYGYGLREGDFERLMRTFPGRKLLDYGFPVASALWSMCRSRILGHRRGAVPPLPNGLIRGRVLRKFVGEVLRNRSACMPCYIIATDLLSGKPIVFSNDSQAQARGLAAAIGDVAEAVTASCSLPGVMTPVQRPPWLLADGACRHYVPVRVLREVGCQKIIAVNLYQLDADWTPHSFVHVLSRSIDILLQETVDNDVDGGDLLVLTPNVGKMTWLSFDEIETALAAGERAVEEQRGEIEAFLREPSPLPRHHRAPRLRIQ
ncbi:patatin-like phospholipase family protein [Alicyclobacillus cycloheptanicus]|uniref:NTE family protein n=1 Tax=Alicyclobacillus cycloheptanicus TaxID=1457 RepID=A0ABT9XDX3_9BACL|nr:patatin-like phospholipase family protein [Alicyclobacillus cycloheptanicus]MDQ0188499.1 NTE family protein [Alicyclobacillus cycloheptanicus]WDM01187.1 patatin-like phospholipase family protein [Alicyclobacillus cycloheptanicus]